MQIDDRTPRETLNGLRVWFHFRGMAWSPNSSHLSDQELQDLTANSGLGDDPDKVKATAQNLLEVAERYAQHCSYLYEKRSRLQA